MKGIKKYTFIKQRLEEAAAVNENRIVKQLIIGDLIAVITPFARQKAILKLVLQKANIPMKNLSIGTVHALQGAKDLLFCFHRYTVQI